MVHKMTARHKRPRLIVLDLVLASYAATAAAVVAVAAPIAPPAAAVEPAQPPPPRHAPRPPAAPRERLPEGFPCRFVVF